MTLKYIYKNAYTSNMSKTFFFCCAHVENVLSNGSCDKLTAMSFEYETLTQLTT